MIVRKLYLDRIEPFMDKSLIKILVGQRRIGKSYILQQIIDKIKSKSRTADIIYINMEDFQFDWIKNYKQLIKYVEKTRKYLNKVYLLIDEIQEIESFEKALRHFQTSGTYDIYCSGSNSKLLSAEIASMLAGRYIQIRIYSLSYNEFLEFHNLENNNNSLLKYMKYGGMPYLINLKDEPEIYYEYLENVYDSIVLRDIVSRYNIRNVNFLRDLVVFLCDNIGSIVSAKKISDYLKSQNIRTQPKSVLEYLAYLENVFFIDRVKRMEVNGKKIFEIGDKFYFEDLGIKHAIAPFRQNDINKILENLVYHHLKIMQYKVHVGKLSNKEIDFVAEKNNKKVFIQVAYMLIDDKTREREFGNLNKISEHYPKMVISMDEYAEGDYHGIEHWSVRKFLTQFK